MRLVMAIFLGAIVAVTALADDNNNRRKWPPSNH